MQSARPPLRPADLGRLARKATLGVVIGSAVAWALVPLDPASPLTAGLIVAAAALTSWFSDRVAGSFAAMAGGIWFGYAHAEPPFESVITNPVDAYFTIGIIVIGLAAAEVVHVWQRGHG